MESKEDEVKRLTEGHQEAPPPYNNAYGYPVQGQAYGYPPQQMPPQQVYGQPPPQVYGQPQPHYGHAAPQYGQPLPQYGQPQFAMGQYNMPQQPGVNQPHGAYPQQVIVVTAGSLADPPSDHLVFNIIMTLFCCWPIGICAIMKSLECRTAIQNGDRQRAENLSRSARRLGMWTLGIGVFFLTLFFVMCLLLAIAD